MRVQLHSTDKIVHLNGVPARIWEGITEGGIQCHAFITRIACDEENLHKEEFERDLIEHEAPSTEIAAIPLRMIL